jgi:hypothetical protein
MGPRGWKTESRRRKTENRDRKSEAVAGKPKRDAYSVPHRTVCLAPALD